MVVTVKPKKEEFEPYALPVPTIPINSNQDDVKAKINKIREDRNLILNEGDDEAKYEIVAPKDRIKAIIKNNKYLLLSNERKMMESWGKCEAVQVKKIYPVGGYVQYVKKNTRDNWMDFESAEAMFCDLGMQEVTSKKLYQYYHDRLKKQGKKKGTHPIVTNALGDLYCIRRVNVRNVIHFPLITRELVAKICIFNLQNNFLEQCNTKKEVAQYIIQNSNGSGYDEKKVEDALSEKIRRFRNGSDKEFETPFPFVAKKKLKGKTQFILKLATDEDDEKPATDEDDEKLAADEDDKKLAADEDDKKPAEPLSNMNSLLAQLAKERAVRQQIAAPQKVVQKTKSKSSTKKKSGRKLGGMQFNS